MTRRRGMHPRWPAVHPMGSWRTLHRGLPARQRPRTDLPRGEWRSAFDSTTTLRVSRKLDGWRTKRTLSSLTTSPRGWTASARPRRRGGSRCARLRRSAQRRQRVRRGGLRFPARARSSSTRTLLALRRAELEEQTRCWNRAGRRGRCSSRRQRPCLRVSLYARPRRGRRTPSTRRRRRLRRACQRADLTRPRTHREA
jgi:hypothetical protein